MRTQCSSGQFEFQEIGKHRVVSDLEGGTIMTSCTKICSAPPFENATNSITGCSSFERMSIALHAESRSVPLLPLADRWNRHRRRPHPIQA